MDPDVVVRWIVAILGLGGTAELIRGFMARRRTSAETQRAVAEGDSEHADAAAAVSQAARELIEPLTRQLRQQRVAMSAWTSAVRAQLAAPAHWEELAVSDVRPLPPPPPLDLPDFVDFLEAAR